MKIYTSTVKPLTIHLPNPFYPPPVIHFFLPLHPMKIANKPEVKHELLNACLAVQQKKVDNANAAMKQAQESANGEKGSMGDKFESFREQMQIDRDMHAKQYDEASEVLATMLKIDADKPNTLVALGAVALTDFQNLFISASLGQVKVGENTFVAVSLSSPIYLILAGKKKGDRFTFRDKEYKILDVF